MKSRNWFSKYISTYRPFLQFDAHLVGGQFLYGELVLNIHKPRNSSNRISYCPKGKDRI